MENTYSIAAAYNSETKMSLKSMRHEGKCRENLPILSAIDANKQWEKCHCSTAVRESWIELLLLLHTTNLSYIRFVFKMLYFSLLCYSNMHFRFYSTCIMFTQQQCTADNELELCVFGTKDWTFFFVITGTEKWGSTIMNVKFTNAFHMHRSNHSSDEWRL